MIRWELPPDDAVCPHCGSTDTSLTLQLLGLIRFSCNSCRKSFALQADAATRATKPAAAPPREV